jgi:tol-pal system protein YbgF
MLQRQVYRSAGGSVVPAGSSAAVDSELRMDRLETEMRELTGRVEDAINGVEQLRRRLEQINSDIDVRFGQGQGQPTPPQPRSTGGGAVASAVAGTPPARGAPPAASTAPVAPHNPPMPTETLVPPPPYTSTGLGTLTPPKSPAGSQPFAPEPEKAGTGGVRPLSSGGLPAGSASEQYNFAFGLLKQADYPAAEAALKSFVRQHPNDGLAGSAQYWLGETYYVRGNYAEAAIVFAEGYKRYPKGTKAADDLLKLSMSLARANQKQNACTALAQLDRDFPNPGSALKERAKDEKKKLGC